MIWLFQPFRFDYRSPCNQMRISFALSNPSTHRPFYSNHVVDLYLKDTDKVTLRQLIVYGRSITSEKLIKSANYVRTQLPIRLAHRIRDFQVGYIFYTFWWITIQFTSTFTSLQPSLHLNLHFTSSFTSTFTSSFTWIHFNLHVTSSFTSLQLSLHFNLPLERIFLLL